jgi:hypothetical protein
VNAATANLMQVLESPRSSRAAAVELAAHEGALAESDFVSVVAESLRHLEQLGLIERCDP